MDLTRVANEISITSIRPMHEDLEKIDRLWQSGNWNYGIKYQRFITDQECCENKLFVAVYKGDIVGTGTAYRVNEDIGALGGFFVKQEYRNLGIGQKIWDARMDYLGDRNINVDARAKRANKDIRLGFIHLVQQLDIYFGVPNSYEFNFEEYKDEVDKIVPIQDVDFEELVAYDSSIVKVVNKSNFLKVAIQKYNIRGFVAYKDKSIIGYIGELPANDFAIIAPLYGQSPRVANALLKKFISDLPHGLPVFLTVPHSNEYAKVLVNNLGLHTDEYEKSLFNKHSYDVQWGSIYGIIGMVTWLW